MKKYNFNYSDLDETLDFHYHVFGKDYELNMTMEEYAELIQAVNKCYRYPNNENGIDNRENLIEEIVDVEIMISVLKKIFKIADIEELKFFKIKNKKIYDYAKQIEKIKE